MSPVDQAASRDEHWMHQAIELAKQGWYTTRPNPVVGCVIVKSEQQIGSGFHQRAGGPHAEVFALREAGIAAQGATAYVTLEPCAHTGRTPPCALALIDAGVSRVVMASLDSNPLVAGKGKALLEAAGIACTVGVCEQEARVLNPGFLRVMAGGLPWVRLKIGMSLDGRTAMASGESKWITGAASRLDVQSWRARSGAIITGSGTVLADDPAMTVRELPELESIADIPQPLVAILDRSGRVKPEAQLFRQPDRLRVFGSRSPVAAVPAHPAESLVSVLEQLRDRDQVREVLVEAGPALSGAFIQAGLVDELIVYQAPTLLGERARPMVQLGLERLEQQVRWSLREVVRFGEDVRLVFVPI